ncbi:MAG TPA: Ldh family oxidoreductase, partial [Ferruginibacter sp.]|nr:Ldh family oxidoreductase [Ferruginibacter sp.]
MPQTNSSAKDNDDVIFFAALQLRQFTASVFMSFGVSEKDAIMAADVLAYSDEHGIDSHGIARLKTYFD